MAQTVIGFFDKTSEAHEAVENLVSMGISRERIDLSGNRHTDSNDDDHEKHENAITKFFKNLFGSDDDGADKYSRIAQRSEAIITVHATSREEAEDAADVLDDAGAIDVDKKAEEYGYSGAGMGSRGERSTERNYGNDTEKIDVIREDIEVGKREVERGGVRLRSRIVERPVEETIRLREERINVERTPVNRNLSEGEISDLQDQNIEMIERAEVPVVNKQSKVVEEVKLKKDVTEREETIRDTVRNTEIDVDDISNKNDNK